VTRLKLAWHVLRGRPLIYRVKFDGPLRLHSVGANLVVTEVEIITPFEDGPWPAGINLPSIVKGEQPA
jgi:hypothetical protein